MVSAGDEITRALGLLVENAPVVCGMLPDRQTQCSVLCVTKYAMSSAQRRAALVYVTGAAGLHINKLGEKKFTRVLYMDRDLAKQSQAMEMPAATAASISRRARADQMTAEGIIAAASAGFKTISFKK